MKMTEREHRTGDHHPAHQVDLGELARQAMIARGLEPDFPDAAQKQLAGITAPAKAGTDVRDLRSMLWCSIDNDDSRDLDQLSVARPGKDGTTTIFVAVADVDALVKKGTPIDDHARRNTTSVYTGVRIFPMLPEKLSTDLTSLNESEERVAVVIEMDVKADGLLARSDVYRALVHNKAKLAYNSVGAWLEGQGEMSQKIGPVKGLAENLKLQDQMAQKLRELRHEHGALELETIEPRTVLKDGKVVDLEQEKPNRAKELIEDFMVASNGVTARFLADHNVAGLRRVVRSPERWDRIEAIAADLGDRLPPDPDSEALAAFLIRRRKADPLRFPDLSLSIVKAMGAGEYVVEQPGSKSIGHFGLAVRDYTHSTAPNRRFPDLVTHRLIKSVLAGAPPAYDEQGLGTLATHCTEQEDAANKVERQVRKSAAALVLSDRIGERFDAIVTGHSEKGTWVRVFHPPVEGKLVHGAEDVDIGQKVKVKLISTDVERGFIDFVRTVG
jgi:exoribonuclease-2